MLFGNVAISDLSTVLAWYRNIIGDATSLSFIISIIISSSVNNKSQATLMIAKGFSGDLKKK